MFGNLLVTGNFVINALKSLTFIIDRGIYGLAGTAYRVFYYLADASLVNDLESITTKMYAILGIIMIFVLAFNLLNYIVDPDKIKDKKVGAATFVKDVILAIVIIAVTPILFFKLYALQSKIITSGVIDTLILGGTATNDSGYDEGSYASLTDYYVQTGANSMVASVYVAFLYPDGDANFSALDCTTEYTGEYKDYCDAYLAVKQDGDLDHFEPFIKSNKFNFTPFITTVAGIVLMFFIFSFCLNLAKRVGKMAILQIIAPIPVTLEILPNKKGLRDNWLKTLVSVYLESFFFLLVIYLIVFLISLVPTIVGNLFGAIEGIAGPVKLLTMVFLIFGLLFFGKEAPQMIFDLLGIKSKGIISEAAKRAVKMAGATTAGLGAGATLVTRGGVNGIKNAWEAGKSGDVKGAVGALGSGVIGAATGGAFGFARGMYMNRTGGFKNIRSTTSNAINKQLESQRRTSRAFGDYASSIGSAHGIKGKLGAAVGTPIMTGAKTAGGAIGKWATGSNYGAKNAELQSYNRYKGVFDATKIKPATDDRYLSFQKDLDKVFADNRINANDFNAKKKAYIDAHAGSTLNDYLSSSDFATDFGSAGIAARDDISRLSSAMDVREAAMKVAKKDDLIVAVAKAKALIEGNSDIAKIAKDNGIDIASISINGSSSDADIIAAYDKLKKLDSKAGDRIRDINAEIAAKEMREQNKKDGGGSGSK